MDSYRRVDELGAPVTGIVNIIGWSFFFWKHDNLLFYSENPLSLGTLSCGYIDEDKRRYMDNQI